MALLPVADALARVIAGVEPTESETVSLLQANGRILAAAVAARLTQPPFDCSAMDGFAVRHTDVATVPARLVVIGEAAAGHSYSGTIGAGQCVRISTGAPVPAGADCVVIQEDTERDGDTVTVKDVGSPGQHIRRRGFDFASGQPMIDAGRSLEARAIALAAAAGHGSLPVRRRPIVAILATGDELVEPGETPAADQIVSSNSYGLAAMVEAAGGEPRLLGIARDTRASLSAKIAEADGADILITIGGASVGDHDLVGPMLQESGAAIDFWRIAMRPGKPLMFGRRGTQRVLGLPGNPVSCLVTARVFLVPLIRAMLGLDAGTDLETAVLSAPIEANGPRQHYMRASLALRGAALPTVAPLRSQDSAALSLLASAGCLIVRPAGALATAAGTEVEILRLDV
ncbi:MAG: molybdopterin molybdotransferase MoeA [Hyphomicrobiaceae bacterium]|nr:molybdopterin molybdotransferase MoeA [Hyphomicrobiaceae bacterium]